MAMIVNAFATGGAELATEICCNCGVAFAMDSGLYYQRQRDRQTFYCPNGHGQHYTGETPDQVKIRELTRQRDAAISDAARQKQNREWAESRAKGANIAAGKAKAAARRLEHRVSCGVCPKCHRTFKQLAAHMKTKHGAGAAAPGRP